MTQSIKYPVGFYFSLSYNGEDSSFQEVSGISKELNIEEVTSGGENRFKYRLPKANSSQNLVLKRGLISKSSRLIEWCKSSIDEGLANAIITHDISVSLLDENSLVVMAWTFHNAYPIKYAISDFKSDENTLVIESIEIAYSYFEIFKK